MKSNKIILTLRYGTLALIFDTLLKLLVDIVFNILKVVFNLFIEDAISTIVSGILCALLIFFCIIKRNLPASTKFDNKNSWIQFIFGSTILLASYNLIYQNTIGLINLGLGPFKFFIDLVETLDLSVFDICVYAPIIEEFFIEYLYSKN